VVNSLWKRLWTCRKADYSVNKRSTKLFHRSETFPWWLAWGIVFKSLHCNQNVIKIFKFIRRCISAVWPRLWPQLEVLRNSRTSQIQSNSCHRSCESACWWLRLADSLSGLSVFSYFYLVTKPRHTPNISTWLLSYWTYFTTAESSHSMRKLTLRNTEHSLDNQILLISACISLLIIDEGERQWAVKRFPRDRIQGKNCQIITFLRNS